MWSFSARIGLGSEANAWKLSRRSMVVLLIYGLTILLIHLGDRRVLTRHEVLAAQPGREMLWRGTVRAWMLPTLAGLPREAKPPGMMWLVAGAIYVFRSDAEWVARLPSALAGLWVAVLMGRLAARWFGDRIGRLAGLLQLSFVYTLMQAKLAEADMCLGAAVCVAMCALASGVIDSPAGVDKSRGNRVSFWLAIAAAFLLKGPIGLVFMGTTAVLWGLIRRDGRVIRFIAEPFGIAAAVVLMAGWPLAAWGLDHSIIHTWRSEAIGTATGTFGSDPFYYYFWSVPVMLLPWLGFVVIGLWRGPNAELAGAVVRQADRAALWQFLLCWFVPGIVFLTVGMKMKHHHYSIPILPPLTIPAALGFDYFVRRQTSRRQGLVWPFFLAGCLLAMGIVWKGPWLAAEMKRAIVPLIGVFAVGGLAALHYERARRPGLMKTAYFLTAWAVAVGVQSWVMPAQDDFRYQADFAREVNGRVPPGATVYMLGDREEEQEAEYAYYLRFPMQRLVSPGDLPHSGGPVYAIAPARVLPGEKRIAVCAGLRAKETEGDRLGLLRMVGSQ